MVRQVRFYNLAWRLACQPELVQGGKAHRRAFGAMVGNLRLNHERRLVDQNIASWNRITTWLMAISRLRAAA